jgi:hypothetical protein
MGFKELDSWFKGKRMKIPKAIRLEIEKGILEHLKSTGLIIASLTFNYGLEVIYMRFLIFNKAGERFVRRLSFNFKRERTLDPYPERNLGDYDEVYCIEVILDKDIGFTTSSYPNEEPNFKLPKFVKNGLNKIILDYLKRINQKEDPYIINTPSFKYFKNRILVKYFDGKFIERKMKFRFKKSNLKIEKPTNKVNRIVKLIVGESNVLKSHFSYITITEPKMNQKPFIDFPR